MREIVTLYSSAAIWVEEGGEPPDLQIHINYWLLRRKLAINREFLDLGIRIGRPKTGKLCIYLPGKAQVTSLGVHFKREQLARAVFNENVSVGGADKKVELEFQDHKKLLVYDLGADDFLVEQKKGTTIVIDLSEIASRVDAAPDLYFRLRCTGDFPKQIVRIERPGRIPFESVHTATQVVDFRMNEIRSLEPSIKERLLKGHHKFTLVHFFLILPSQDEYHTGSPSLVATRDLEKPAWHEYLGKPSCLYDLYSAYHWKKDGRKDGEVIADFTIYTKLKRTKFGPLASMFYLSAIFLLSFLGSCAYDALTKNLQLPWLPNSMPKCSPIGQPEKGEVSLRPILPTPPT